MKICFLCPEYPPGPHGGIGATYQVMARRLAQSGHQVKVLAVKWGESGPPIEQDDGGVQVVRVQAPATGTGSLQARYELFRIGADWARRGVIDLIESADYEGWTAAWPKFAVPKVLRLHGSATYFATEIGGRIHRPTRWLEASALRSADFVCSCSRYTAEQTQRLFGTAPIRWILYNSVEVSAEPPPAFRDSQAVVYSGTLARKKGVIPMIAAWPTVRRICPEAELHVYGKDGRTESGQSMRDFLISTLPEFCRDSVHFHDHVGRQELLGNLRRARAAVFPSYAEAFAMAPLEAMSQGCPTIHTTRSSGPEMIRHEQDGLLVEPDRPEEIAGAMIRLLTNDELAASLGQAGWRRVRDNFADDCVMSRNLDFYHHCVGGFDPAKRSRLDVTERTGGRREAARTVRGERN